MEKSVKALNHNFSITLIINSHIFAHMLNEIFTALIVAAFFGIGALLYHFTAEEIDSFKKRFQSKFLSNAKNVALAPVAMLGIIQAVAITTQQFGTISLLLLATSIIFGSFVVAEKNRKLTLKYTAETIITFLVFFATVYTIITLLS